MEKLRSINDLDILLNPLTVKFWMEVGLNRTFDTPLFTSDQSVDRVLNAGLPVLMVFTSGTVQPGLKSTLDKIASQNAGKLLVVQAALQDAPQAARRFGVAAAPAVVAFKDGQPQAKGEKSAPMRLSAMLPSCWAPVRARLFSPPLPTRPRQAAALLRPVRRHLAGRLGWVILSP